MFAIILANTLDDSTADVAPEASGKIPQVRMRESTPPVGHPCRIHPTISVSGSPASASMASQRLLWNNDRLFPTSTSGKTDPNSAARAALAFKMALSENPLHPGLPMDSTTDVVSSTSHSSS